MTHPRIMLAAPKSGSGKTLLTCSLLRALSMRGKRVQAFKCGPDYIDPMFHKKVLGIPSRNLDLFFTGEEDTKALFLEENDAEISVIEGVMGLYDGLAGTMEEASSYHLARTLQTPILLVINARGMGRSVLAEIAGFLSMDREHLIQGVILNQVSASFFQSIAELIEEECHIPVFGYYPIRKDMEWQSRYLGLKMPEEIRELQAKVTEAAEAFEKTISVDAIIRMAMQFAMEHPLSCERPFWLNAPKMPQKVRIGVAFDEAFCFYYEDNFRLLEKAGAELCFFSPLQDPALPEEIQGLLLGGGYPELVAEQLSGQEGLRREIKERLQQGMPSLAECGGFMYLHKEIVTPDGRKHPMVGVIPGKCFDTGKLVRFGYASFRFPGKLSERFSGRGSSEFPERFTSELVGKHGEKNDGDAIEEIRGHEFHYYDSDACGTDCEAVKPVTGRSWLCGYLGENHYWSYGHLYYPSNPAFAFWFVEQCRRWRK
ncbi:MAG: cobyrinate a,c-diamide synthase [Lachnospiraceae bacterium]|nr:cobyrinate a,c-diamide synthase [Lachnospiraceae bacterium]